MDLRTSQNRIELVPEELGEVGFVENVLGLRAPGDSVCLMRLQRRRQIVLVTVREPIVDMDVKIPGPRDDGDPALDEPDHNGVTPRARRENLRESIRDVLRETAAVEWGVDPCEVDAELARREAAAKGRLADYVERSISGTPQRPGRAPNPKKKRRRAAKSQGASAAAVPAHVVRLYPREERPD
jgi:hypothetical protein